MQVMSAAYAAMSIVSFTNVESVYKDKTDSLDNDVLWSLLVATLLGPIVVIAYFFFGTLIMMRKTVAESGLGYSFGMIHISSLWLSVFMLQCGVTVQAFRQTFKDEFELRAPPTSDPPCCFCWTCRVQLCRVDLVVWPSACPSLPAARSLCHTRCHT